MLLSVLTPTHNAEKYIARALRSTASDLSGDLEHLIADGSSSDGTQEVVVRARRAEVKLVSESDSGQSDGLNAALSKASGDWIGWLNADELYLPGTLASLSQILNSSQTPDVVYGDVYMFGQGGRERWIVNHGPSTRVLRTSCYIPSCTFFVRRRLLEALDGWDRNLRRVMDWDLYFRLARSRAKFVYYSSIRAAFEMRPDRVTAAWVDRDAEEWKFLQETYGVVTGGPRYLMGRAERLLRKTATGAHVRSQLRRTPHPSVLSRHE